MKRLIALVCAFILCFSFSTTAFADSITTEPLTEVLDGSSVEPRAEELEWVYRIHDGNLEKRLWSNTYGVWRTDWIYVGPASLVQ